MYKVLHDFIEKNHDGHVYRVGDTYPVAGKKLVKARATELTKVHATYGVAFLKEVEAPKPVKPKAEKAEGDA